MLREDDRNINNSLMGQELGDMFSDMCSQWAIAQYKWDNWMLLFNADGEKILGKLSGMKYIQGELTENLIVSMCRLLDRRQTAGKLKQYINTRYKNNTFAKEVKSKINAAFMYLDLGYIQNDADGDDTPKMTAKIKKQNDLPEKNSIRAFRNRRIAHRDPTFHQTTLKLVDASKLALDATHDALETIYKYYAHKALPRIVPSSHDRLPAQDLLKSLSELIQAHEN